MNLTTYLRAGYPGLAIVSSGEARAEAEVASACTALKRKLLAWSSTEGLTDVKEGRVNLCPDPLDALQLLDGIFASDKPRHVVLLRDLQLHLDQSDPMLVRRIKDVLRLAKATAGAFGHHCCASTWAACSAASSDNRKPTCVPSYRLDPAGSTLSKSVSLSWNLGSR